MRIPLAFASAAALAAACLADTYRGTVQDAATRKGLAGVAVSLKGWPGAPVLTDAAGGFVMNTSLAIGSGPSAPRLHGLVWDAAARTFSWPSREGSLSLVARDLAGRRIGSWSVPRGGEGRITLPGGARGLLAVEARMDGGREGFLILDLDPARPAILLRNSVARTAAAKAAAGTWPGSDTLVFQKAGYMLKEVPVEGDGLTLSVDLPPFAGVLFRSADERMAFNVAVGVDDTVSNVRADIAGAALAVRFLKPNTETYGPTGAPQEQKQNNFVFDLGQEKDARAYRSLKFRIRTNVDLKVWVFAGKVPVTDPHVLTYTKPGEGVADYYLIPAGVDGPVALSLDSNFIGLDKSRLRGITFRTASGAGCPLERRCTTWPDMRMTLSDVRLDADEVFKPRVKRAFLPPEGRKYLVIGQGIDGIDHFYAKAPVNRPAGVMGYLSAFDWNYGWGDWGGAQSGMDLRRVALDPSLDGTVLQVALGMWLGEASGASTGKGCKEIAAGRYDAHLDVVADRIKSMRRPVFLRLNHELDNPSHLCSSPGAVGTEYAGAVRHIVTRFHRRGVQNVAYVMHLWTWGNQQHWADWFRMPFVDEYIDWVGVSSLVEGVDAANINAVAGLSGKPVMIAEFARNGGPTAEWLEAAFRFAKGSARIRMMCLINQNAVYGPVRFGEFSVQHMAAYEAGAADPAFLKQGDVKFAYTESAGMSMAW